MSNLTSLAGGQVYLAELRENQRVDRDDNVTKENGESIHIGNYASSEELDKALNDAVDNGQLSQAEANAAHQQ